MVSPFGGRIEILWPDPGAQPVGSWEPTSCRGALRFASPLWSPGGGIERIQKPLGESVPPGRAPSVSLCSTAPPEGEPMVGPYGEPGTILSPYRGGARPRPAGEPGRYRNPGRIRSARGCSKRGAPLLGVSIRVGLGRGRNRNLPLPSVVSLWFFLFGQAKRKNIRLAPQSPKESAKPKPYRAGDRKGEAKRRAPLRFERYVSQ